MAHLTNPKNETTLRRVISILPLHLRVLRKNNSCQVENIKLSTLTQINRHYDI